MTTRVLNEHPEENNSNNICILFRRHSVLCELYSFNKFVANRTLDVNPTMRSLTDNMKTIKYAFFVFKIFDFMYATTMVKLSSIVANVKNMLNIPNARLFRMRNCDVIWLSMQFRFRFLLNVSTEFVSFI